MEMTRYISNITDVRQLPIGEARELEKITSRFPFGATDYYLSLINWGDREDPIRRLIIPTLEETEEENWGTVDASCECNYSVVTGVQHKYADTALMLLSDLCYGRCRYCFRKRLFMEYSETEILKNISDGINYIESHHEINNVLLTGGDPLKLSTESLKRVFAALRNIDHVKVIRVGTKAPAFDPYRITNDEKLPEVIRQFSTPKKRIYFMVHFSHPREITEEAVKAVDILIKSGAILCNQTPIIRGVNDDPWVLGELFKKLSFIGVAPYYVFQIRPTVGNKPYAIPLTEAYQIFHEAQKGISGLARRAVFAMSHGTGKIEVAGMDDSRIYMKYHRSPNWDDIGKLIVARRDDEGHWLDDFDILSEVNV